MTRVQFSRDPHCWYVGLDRERRDLIQIFSSLSLFQTTGRALTTKVTAASAVTAQRGIDKARHSHIKADQPVNKPVVKGNTKEHLSLIHCIVAAPVFFSPLCTSTKAVIDELLSQEAEPFGEESVGLGPQNPLKEKNRIVKNLFYKYGSSSLQLCRRTMAVILGFFPFLLLLLPVAVEEKPS